MLNQNSGVTKLFAYGTLQLGEQNFCVLKPWAQRIEFGEVLGRLYSHPGGYPALSLPGMPSAGLRPSQGPLVRVQGQLIDVGSAPLDPDDWEGAEETVWDRLDRFEGYNPWNPMGSNYTRKLIMVLGRGGIGPVWAWVYVCRLEQTRPEGLPEWPEIAEWRGIQYILENGWTEEPEAPLEASGEAQTETEVAV